MSQAEEKEEGHAFAVPHLLSVRRYHEHFWDKQLMGNFLFCSYFVITDGNDDDDWMRQHVSGNNWVA